MELDPSTFLKYETATGEFYWLPRDLSFFASYRSFKSWNSRYAGKLAGSNREGYIWISINYKNYSAHRLAWKFFYGDWPKNDIDHINGIKSDNRISNLRCVSKAENNKNTPMRKTNTSGFVGVYWNRFSNGWDAKIGVSGKLLNIGRYKTFDEAVSARLKYQNIYGYHENHGRSA